MEDNKIIITVSGTDKVGIVAMVAQILADNKINIEDIKQTLMQGHFVMFMLCDISNSTVSFKEFKTTLTDACSKLEMEVWVQRKAIFDKMHTI
jgi:ACT domain-containing protein